MIDLWLEGHIATGEQSHAQYLGSYDTDSYIDAVIMWHKENWNHSRYGNFALEHSGHYSLWDCKIYDNEEDARKLFG